MWDVSLTALDTITQSYRLFQDDMSAGTNMERASRGPVCLSYLSNALDHIPDICSNALDHIPDICNASATAPETITHSYLLFRDDIESRTNKCNLHRAAVCPPIWNVFVHIKDWWDSSSKALLDTMTNVYVLFQDGISHGTSCGTCIARFCLPLPSL